MSEHTMSEIPTPMDAIKQIYELFQTRENFTTGCLARNRRDIHVATNHADACCWCLGGAVFHIYNMNIYRIACLSNLPEALSISLNDTFKLLWEKLPAESKINILDISIWNYIDGIAIFNDRYGYAGVMRLLQAVIDDTEYMQEV